MENKIESNIRRHPMSAGFTLVEIMIVVTILGLLATLAVVSAPSIIHSQRVKAAKQNIARISNAVDMYNVETGKYPKSLDELAGKSDAKGVKFLKTVPKDPWGNDFVFRVPGEHNEEYSISCYGADGLPGGDGRAADINSWDVEEGDQQK